MPISFNLLMFYRLTDQASGGFDRHPDRRVGFRAAGVGKTRLCA